MFTIIYTCMHARTYYGNVKDFGRNHITELLKILGGHALRSNSEFWEQMHTILTLQFCICNFIRNFTIAVLHLHFAFAFFHLQICICNFHFYTEFPRILGTKQSTILHFWKHLQFWLCSLSMQFCVSGLHFQNAFAILTFHISIAILHFQIVIAFFVFWKQMQFCIFWKHFYQQFASQKITKTITRRQIPAAIPEMNNIRLNARRTLFLQVLLTTCPPYFPTRIVLAPFVSWSSPWRVASVASST